MRRLATTLFLLAALPLLAAGLPAPYTGTPTARDYPGSDVLVLSESLDYSVAADGKVTLRAVRVEKVLTYQGMDVIGDPKVAFRKGDQVLRDYGLKTFTPEGQVVEAAPNSFTEITPFDLERAPDYTLLRQMVLSKVGLDVGAVVETRYTLEDTRPWRRYLNLELPLTDGFPALERTVVVSVPESTPLRYASFGLSVEPDVRREGGRTSYIWRLKDLKAFSLGQASPAEQKLLPKLVATTCPDWKAADRAYATALAEAVKSTSPALEKKTDALLRDQTTEFQKAAALAAYVAEAIPTVHWPLEGFDYGVRPAARVFDSGYGHALDKAVLLCAMLKRAGLDAAPALCALAPEGYPDPEKVPSVGQFDRVIVHLDLAGRTLWIDPTAPLSERSQRDFQGYRGLPMFPGVGEIHTMTPVGEEERLLVALRGTMADDLSMVGEGTLLCSGSYSPYYAVQGAAEGLKDYVAGLLKSVLPGADLTEHSVSVMEPGQVKVEVKFKTQAVASGKGPRGFAFDTPSESALAHLSNLHRAQRELPLLLPRVGREEVTLDVTLPKGIAPRFVPGNVSESCPTVQGQRTVSVLDGHLQVKQSLTISRRLLPALEYKAFRTLYGRMTSATGRTVLF